jgi:hypothetical protein
VDLLLTGPFILFLAISLCVEESVLGVNRQGTPFISTGIWGHLCPDSRTKKAVANNSSG